MHDEISSRLSQLRENTESSLSISKEIKNSLKDFYESKKTDYAETLLNYSKQIDKNELLNSESFNACDILNKVCSEELSVEDALDSFCKICNVLQILLNQLDSISSQILTS